VGREGTILWLLWGFVAFCALSAVWAQVSSADALNASYDLFKALVASSALVWAIRSESDASRLMMAFTVGVFHAGALHSFGARFGYIPASMDRDEGVLVNGQSPVMVMFLPLLILLMIKGSKLQRVLACVALPFVLDSIVKSYQRTALVGLLVEALLLFWFLPRRITLRAFPVIVDSRRRIIGSAWQP
jgi:hypothetical protein